MKILLHLAHKAVAVVDIAHVDLCQARNPGKHLETGPISRDFTQICLGVAVGIGAWPNEAHLAAQNVYDLGKLINSGSAQHMTQRCDAMAVQRIERPASQCWRPARQEHSQTHSHALSSTETSRW